MRGAQRSEDGGWGQEILFRGEWKEGVWFILKQKSEQHVNLQVDVITTLLTCDTFPLYTAGIQEYLY